MSTETPRHPSEGGGQPEPPVERKIIPITHTQWSAAPQDRCKHCERPIFLDNFEIDPENLTVRWRHVNQELDNRESMELRGIKYHEAELKPYSNPYGQTLLFGVPTAKASV